jgi:pimeloyl-ACP methyl ester carboxylesterase
VHVRDAGEGQPLLMLHASPGSSKQLESKIAALAQGRRLIAPDTPGNGDSTPLPLPAPAITDYAAATLEFLDAIGLETCDVYGSHTGASIAVELALLAPGRIDRVVIDGIGVYSDAERANYLANYALTIEPDLIGSQFHRAFMFCRDQYLFWPWFETAAANRREGGLPDPQVLHDWVLEVCKAISTYHLGYRASFAHRAEDRLGLLTQETLFLAAENDPLLASTRTAATLPARGRLALLGHSASADYAAVQARTIEEFLGAAKR